MKINRGTITQNSVGNVDYTDCLERESLSIRKPDCLFETVTYEKISAFARVFFVKDMYIYKIVHYFIIFSPKPLSPDSWREWSVNPDKNGSIPGNSVEVALSITSCCLLISCCLCFSLSLSNWSCWSLICCAFCGEVAAVACHAGCTKVLPGARCWRCCAKLIRGYLRYW